VERLTQSLDQLITPDSKDDFHSLHGKEDESLVTLFEDEEEDREGSTISCRCDAC